MNLNMNFEFGLERMKDRYLDRTQDEYLEFLNFDLRLRSALQEARLYGPTPENHAEQLRAASELNRVALTKFNITFNELCQSQTPSVLAALEEDLQFIPGGEFLMGSDTAGEEEGPLHTVMVEDFYISRYPVTNAQYQQFVVDVGYHEPQNWTGNRPPKVKENHPVVLITWFDAYNYCIWLRLKTGRSYRLPTEAEWEKAARGGKHLYTGNNPHPERSYPWGLTFAKHKCNTVESRLGDSTPIGYYVPADVSPYGISDLAGNVWEWTGSLWTPYPYNASDGRESINVYPRPILDPQSHEYRFEGPPPDLKMDAYTKLVMRGGSWGLNRNYARCSSRIWSSAGNSGEFGGFRLAGNALKVRANCGTVTRFL